MRLCEDASELSCCVRAMCEGVQVSEDLLQELHIVLPHRGQSGFFQALLLLLTHKHMNAHMTTFHKSQDAFFHVFLS